MPEQFTPQEKEMLSESPADAPHLVDDDTSEGDVEEEAGKDAGER